MKKVSIGIVGMGQRTCFHGGRVFADVKDRVHIAAVCDVRQDRLEHGRAWYEEYFGGPVSTYADYRDMFDREKLDGAYIAGPNDLHRDMTLAAFKAGLHVLCEKPMDVSLARCDEMIAASKKHDRLLCLAMQMHYRKRYHKVKELIEAGAIGKVAQVWCSEHRGTFAEMKDWVWQKSRSGGAIVEKNCHHTELMDWWVDSTPATVYASGNILKHKEPYGYTSEIVDNAFVIGDYENGARAMLNVCFLGGKGHSREFGVHGTEGKIFFSAEDHEIVHVTYNNGLKEHFDYSEDPGLRGGMTNDFVDCILTGRTPLVTPEMGRRSLLIPLAAERSIDEKRVVHVSELT